LDADGVVVATSEARPSPAQVEAVLSSFTGPIDQVPPAYSALMIDGRRAYDRARAGEDVEMKTRPVTVHHLRTESFDGDEATLTVRVSKGTYIRSLARDIARALGTVGHVTMLRRTKAGPFTLEKAISLDKLGELGHLRELEQALLPLTAGLDDIPALPVTPDQAGLLRQGRKLIGIAAKPGLHLATDQSVPVALVELSGDELRPELRVVRGFNL
jgi:tRNA pseudouridine55 synthase